MNKNRTKIIATVGSSCLKTSILSSMISSGFEIQFERQLSDSPGGFAFNSFYGIIQFNSSSSLIYFARYGYTNFHGDSDFTSDDFFVLTGNAYASVGILKRFSDNIFVEISRSYIKGDINFFGGNDLMWCEYETYNIGVGYYIE